MGMLDVFDSSDPDQLSLDVTTLPADDDAVGVQIARQLADNLNFAGIDATLDPQDDEQAFRTLLIDHDFDIFVGRHPLIDDPDELRALLHTRFTEEPGWQNPYGITSPIIDDLLERQRRSLGTAREDAVEDLQRRLIELQPFSTIGFPSRLTATRRDLSTESIPNGLATRHAYLNLERANPDRDSLRVSLLRSNATTNWNPLVSENETDNAILDLIYEPLFERIDGDLTPWLAEDVTWADSGTSVTATIQLRPTLQWHDDTPLTTADVAFTYEFLQDTTLSDSEDPVPAMRFRGRSSLVDDVDTRSNTEVVLEFQDTSVEVARRALTVPMLPKHRWEDHTKRIQTYQSEALEIDNEEPIGSGPFVFEEATDEQGLTLTRNVDHFLFDIENPDEALEPLIAESTFEEVDFEVAANPGVAIAAIDNGERDITAASLPILDTDALEEEFEELEVLLGEWTEFFLIGFNTRRHPLGNHRFRRIVSRLVDRGYIAEEVASGYAIPSNTPLQRTKYLTEEFEWTGESMLGPFPGEDGEADPELARSLFRDAGFRYDEDGDLLTQQ